MASSSSVMAPIFANQSCDPFQPPESPCTLGNYVRYAVDAANAEHIAETVRFARRHNIRFVIRNTGHDYLGRSTGAGSLAIWTHHLKSIKVGKWNDKHYKGATLEVGAGVQGFEALEAAHKAGLVVVTGECPSVGLAGGYTQGGGHSGLSTVFGLAADNALSYRVVMPAGNVVTASRTENEDLYWALSGGGGGNFGIVVLMTVKAHPDSRVAGAQFSVMPPNDDPDKLYEAIDTMHAALPSIVDAGIMIIYFFGPGFLSVPALTAFNKTKPEVAEVLQPLFNNFTSMGMSVQANLTELSNYYDHFDHYWGPLPAGNIQVGTQLFGGRLIPRDAMPNFGPTARQLVEKGVVFIGVGLDVSRFGQSGANAVLPQWRKALVSASLTLPWSFEAPFSEMLARQDRMTNEIQPLVDAATPGSGAYMNEADFQQPNFQEAFFGANYNKLLGIKRKYDPHRTLYAKAGVGSEDWSVAHDGRMCRAN